MSDILSELKPCPICGRKVMLTLYGISCPPCDYTFEAEGGEALFQTAERYNEHWEQIVKDLEEME